MRVPIGFVVEGGCEHTSFECIVRKGIAATHGELPAVNAWGNGGLRKRLEEHLVSVVKVRSPVVVIVALDMKDALKEGSYADCEALRLDVQARADRWLESVKHNEKLQPLPKRIVVVIQAPVFEAWLTADPDGLIVMTGEPAAAHSFQNVDVEIASHKAWLEQHLPNGYSKSPVHVTRVVKSLHPSRMAQRSRSFRKFWKEVVAAYGAWEIATGSPFLVQDA